MLLLQYALFRFPFLSTPRPSESAELKTLAFYHCLSLTCTHRFLCAAPPAPIGSRAEAAQTRRTWPSGCRPAPGPSTSAARVTRSPSAAPGSAAAATPASHLWRPFWQLPRPVIPQVTTENHQLQGLVVKSPHLFHDYSTSLTYKIEHLMITFPQSTNTKEHHLELRAIKQKQQPLEDTTVKKTLSTTPLCWILPAKQRSPDPAWIGWSHSEYIPRMASSSG